MSKKKSQTEDLLSKLESSLKTSPLTSHARRTTPPIATEKTSPTHQDTAVDFLLSAQKAITASPFREGAARQESTKIAPRIEQTQQFKAIESKIQQMEHQLRQQKAAASASRTSSAIDEVKHKTQQGHTNPQKAIWKSATVGLYSEDYQKVREVMDYIQDQTGEMVNLSRVIKIALRALPLGPNVLEANQLAKSSDRRAGRGRGL